MESVIIIVLILALLVLVRPAPRPRAVWPKPDPDHECEFWEGDIGPIRATSHEQARLIIDSIKEGRKKQAKLEFLDSIQFGHLFGRERTCEKCGMRLIDFSMSHRWERKPCPKGLINDLYKANCPDD